ncbi:hypothetical protein TIFTF001_037473 [Ficus carica]|uniref:Uncharacterized protein n=1 Tax=Ficus carica TaxID=3494 RepID=A0AA88E5D2_FICCA|nr:hypothetical protein TIFTF001_037473 [Ficus carica]
MPATDCLRTESASWSAARSLSSSSSASGPIANSSADVAILIANSIHNLEDESSRRWWRSWETSRVGDGGSLRSFARFLAI